jgi:hypothetical protein
LEGKVSVKVYDMKGELVDSFGTFNDAETRTLDYTLDVPQGLYLFVVQGGGGNFTKKVIIR